MVTGVGARQYSPLACAAAALRAIRQRKDSNVKARRTWCRVAGRAWALVLSALCSPGHAGETADQVAARTQRLEAAQERLLQARDRGDVAACIAERQTMHDDVHADWTRRSLGIWDGITFCEGNAGGAWLRTPPSAQEITAARAPMLAHFARMSPQDRLRHDFWLEAHVHYWAALRQFGYEAQADAHEDQVLEDLLQHAVGATAAGHPGGAAGPREEDATQAKSSLTQYAQMIYGARARIAHMERLQARWAQLLGPGHEAVLILMRTRVFALRQLERPAQALALSNELAASLAQHRPADERLAMLNRSERLGALSALGRYADARAEGEALLAYLQKRQPRSQANLMRAGYNLAGLAIEMGALDDAVAFAELSLREGLLASFSEGRQETHFSRMLLHQARAMRGDEGALQDLRAVLDEATSWDLPALGMLLTLHRLAAGRGDVANEQWAMSKIRFVVAAAAAPMQPAHALPWVLDAAKAQAGSSAGLDAATRALALALAAQDQQTSVNANFALARQAEPARPSGAIWLYKRGANALLKLRQGLSHDEATLPRAWLAEHEAPLRQLIGLLIDEGRLKEAEQAIEMLRDEELHEFRRRSRGPSVRRVGQVSLAATPDEQQRDLEMLPLAQNLRAAAVLAQARAGRHSSDRARTQTADPEAAVALEVAVPAIQAVALSPPSQAGPRPGTAAAKADGQDRTPAGQARLVYVLRTDHTDVLLSTASGHWRVKLHRGSAAVNRAVQDLRIELVSPGTGVPPTAQRLYDWLLRPFAQQLRAVHHLQVVPDGALRYVPFGSLHDGQRYVVERHSVAVELTRRRRPEPERMTHGLRPTPRPIQVAAFGRSLPDERHGALPGVQKELAALKALRGARATSALDVAFTAQALQATLRRRPGLVHLASHFLLDPAGEEASYLLLGDGQRLSLRELGQMPWQGVRLVLLSACDSGITTANGQEWAGFADTLHAAGVDHVMASLWRIDDAGTARWMQAFYEPWRSVGAARALNATHLASVQRKWLRRHAGGTLAHPHHWAAFQWLGGGR